MIRSATGMEGDKKGLVVQPVVKRNGFSTSYYLACRLSTDGTCIPGTGKQPIRFYQYKHWAIDGNGGRVTNILFTDKPLMYIAAPGLFTPYVLVHISARDSPFRTE